MANDYGFHGTITDAVELATTPRKKNLAMWFVCHYIGKSPMEIQQPNGLCE